MCGIAKFWDSCLFWYFALRNGEKKIISLENIKRWEHSVCAHIISICADLQFIKGRVRYYCR